MTANRLALFFFCLLPAFSLAAENRAAYDARMAWWNRARFGLFIHWGLYAIPAGEWNGQTGYGEWIRHSARIPLDRYDRFADEFRPAGFDADAWMKLARRAGMRYVVITTKHHDGFCLFDSAQTDFCIRHTPFGRDVMKEMAAAGRRQGLRLGWYYSIMDWHHPDYLPRRDWETDRSTAGADKARYLAYLKAQLTELLTRYGPVGVLWFDGEWENFWTTALGRDLYDHVRGLQPGIIVNNRVGAGRSGMEGFSADSRDAGDFGTPEQQIPDRVPPGVYWETCMTMNDHWGWNRSDQNWKPVSELIRMLADIASKGGNFLLNVGPTADGLIPEPAVERLREIGRWMKINGSAIHGTGAGPFPPLPWGRCTQRPIRGGTRLYLHVFDWPADGRLSLPGIGNQPLRAWLLADRRPLPVRRRGDALSLSLPAAPPDPADSVVALDIAGRPDVFTAPTIEAAADIFIDELPLSLASPREGVEIRFTLDGSEPRPDSPLAPNPVCLRDSATVAARCFRNGRAVSGTARRAFRRVLPRLPLPAGPARPGLRCRTFAGDWDVLPETAALAAAADQTLPAVQLPADRPSERFACEYSGWVEVPADGVYTFATVSDDGSRLWVGGELVVDNDGLHPAQERSGAVALAAGRHPLRILYFQKSGGAELAATISGPGLARQPLAGDRVGRPD